MHSFIDFFRRTPKEAQKQIEDRYALLKNGVFQIANMRSSSEYAIIQTKIFSISPVSPPE